MSGYRTMQYTDGVRSVPADSKLFRLVDQMFRTCADSMIEAYPVTFYLDQEDVSITFKWELEHDADPRYDDIDSEFWSIVAPVDPLDDGFDVY